MARSSTSIRQQAAPQGSAPLFSGLAPAKAPNRRHWARVGAAAALAIASGALFVALYSSAGSRQAVLALSKPVARGSVIEASDLRVVRVGYSGGLSSIPVSQEPAVVGRRASVTLIPGTLLSAGDLSSTPALPAGWSSVGLSLKASQMPSGLRQGQVVSVVLTPIAGQTLGKAPSSASVMVDHARVLSVAGPSASSTTGDTNVTIAVPSAYAAAVAGAEANSEVALVGQGTGGS